MLDATVDAKDRIERGVAAGTTTDWFACSCGYPTASMTMKATTFGSHAMLSYLWTSFSHLDDTSVVVLTNEGIDNQRRSPAKHSAYWMNGYDRTLRTAREITLMITIPSVSFRCGLTLANVCPPMMQFRTRNPCIEKTFKALGMMDP